MIEIYEAGFPFRNLENKKENIFPFEVQRLLKKKKEILPVTDTDPHRHNFYILVFINKAEGDNSIDFKRYFSHKPLKKVVMLIRPEQVHISKRVGAADILLFRFSKEILLTDKYPILDENENVNLISLKSKEYDSVYSLAENIQKEFYSSNEWKYDIIQSYMNSIMVLLSRSYLSSKTEKNDNIVIEDISLKFQKLVNLHYVKTRKVDEYAKMLFVSPGHLNDTVKIKTGKTAKEIILERVVLEAKRLLYYNDYSIKEICDVLDFNDVAYFSRFFKHMSGESPIDFRMKFREKSK